MIKFQPHQFIGKSRQIAQVLFHKLAHLSPEADPIRRRWLLAGPPGNGKSTLALSIAHTAASPFCVEHINGQDCTVDRIRQWIADGRYVPLQGTWRVQVVDEVDQAKTDATGHLRTYLDTLPCGVLFIATTNKELGALPEHLQSRFQVQYFERVPINEIARLLVAHHCVDAETAADIARRCDGNVRAAIEDAVNAADAVAAMA